MKAILYPVFALCSFLLMACSNDAIEWEPLDSDSVSHITNLHLEGELKRYDVTRATTSEWEDGAIIYILYQTEKGFVNGKAVYNKNDDEWTATYKGSITQGEVSTCKVYYFENALSSNTVSISLSEYSAVFADTLATYLYEDDVIVVKSHLTPQTGRVRFRGTAGKKISVTGLQWNQTFAFTDANLTKKTDILSLTTGSDGYTPYIYASFSDEERKHLNVEDDNENCSYAKFFVGPLLAMGKSGYIDIPTHDSHNGWEVFENEITFEVTGNGQTVTFKMIRVKPGTFQMGSNSGLDEEKPIHTVMFTYNYYIGETEVTNALYKAVMGNSPSLRNQGDNYPVEMVSWNTITDGSTGFLSKLNATLGNQLGSKLFRLPTEAEWEYAARGGHKQSSPNYTYAGSNTIGDVAWYLNNSSITSHPVGKKKANELGLYDMTGNVREWCQDWFSNTYYNNSPSTNPTGPTSGSHRVYRGGSFDINEFYSRVAFRDKYEPTVQKDNMGFRLALSSH